MKRFFRLSVFVPVVCLLFLAACDLTGEETVNLSVTRIELIGSYSEELQDVYFLSSKPTFSETFDLEKVCAKAYVENQEMDNPVDIKKAIRWVSSAPDVISVSKGTATSKGLSLKVEINEANVVDGIYEIHAENFDGSVKSEPVKVVLGVPVEAVTRLSLKTSSSSESSDVIKFESEKNPNKRIKNNVLYLEAYTFADEPFKNKDFEKQINWVSGDSEVAVVSSVKSTYNGKLEVNLELKNEGMTEIYAETKDGKVQSESIKIAYGNQFNKESLASNFAVSYILDHLRYKLKTSDYLPKSMYAHKGFIFDGVYGRVHYANYTDSSTVESREVTFNGDEVKITGMIDTYTEERNAIRFSFAMILKCVPDKNYTSYDIISAKYERPELIVEEIDIGNE